MKKVLLLVPLLCLLLSACGSKNTDNLVISENKETVSQKDTDSKKSSAGKTIDLNDYAIIELRGYNGTATLDVDIDFDSLFADYIEKAKIDGDSEDADWARVGMEAGIDIKCNKSTDLSNGDEYTIIWSVAFDGKTTSGITLLGESKSYKVEGLLEPPTPVKSIDDVTLTDFETFEKYINENWDSFKHWLFVGYNGLFGLNDNVDFDIDMDSPEKVAQVVSKIENFGKDEIEMYIFYKIRFNAKEPGDYYFYSDSEGQYVLAFTDSFDFIFPILCKNVSKDSNGNLAIPNYFDHDSVSDPFEFWYNYEMERSYGISLEARGADPDIDIYGYLFPHGAEVDTHNLLPSEAVKQTFVSLPRWGMNREEFEKELEYYSSVENLECKIVE